MIDALELIRIHLELECKRIDLDDFLYRIPCANPDDMSRFYIAQYNEGVVRYFQYDLPASLCERLRMLSPELAFQDIEGVKRILVDHAPCDDFHVGKSYIFPGNLTPDDYPDVARLEAAPGQLKYAIFADGQIISACESSRENERAGEAWVYTEPAFRGKGYARKVTAAWAHHLQQQGKIPYYSHKLTNVASQSLAHSLRLIHYMDDAAYV